MNSRSVLARWRRAACRSTLLLALLPLSAESVAADAAAAQTPPLRTLFGPSTLNPTGLVLSRDGQFLYAGVNSRQGQQLATFTVGADGKLTYVFPNTPLGRLPDATTLRLDEAGKFLFAGSNQAGISVFTRDTLGRPQPVAGSPFANGGNGMDVMDVHDMALDRGGNYLYVLGQDFRNLPVVSVYAVNRNTGALTEFQKNVAVGNPNSLSGGALTLSADGNYLLVVTMDRYSYNAGTLAVRAINQGRVQEATVSSQPLAMYTPGSITLTPNGRFVYVASDRVMSWVGGPSNQIAGFSFEGGVLTPMPKSPYGLGYTAVTLQPDPSGSRLYVAGFTQRDVNRPAQVAAYSIDPATGDLTQMAAPLTKLGDAPYAMAITPTSQFLYVSAFGISVRNSALLAFQTPAPVFGTLGASVNPPALGLNTTVQSQDGATFAAGGFYYSSTLPIFRSDMQAPGVLQDGAITANVPGSFTLGKTYYAVPYATTTYGNTYVGAATPFLYATTPVLTVAVKDANSDLMLNGTLDAKGTTIVEEGFVYATTADPTVSSNKVAVKGVANTFTTPLSYSLLAPEQTYYFRAYALDSTGKATYSAQTKLTVPPVMACKVPTITPVTLTSPKVLGVNATLNRVYAQTLSGIAPSYSPPALHVIDGNTGKVIKSITANGKTLQLAVNEAKGVVYYTTGMFGMVYAIDANTGEPLMSKELPGVPTETTLLIGVNESTDGLFVADTSSKQVFKLNPADLSVAKKVTLQNAPVQLLVAQAVDKLYMAHAGNFLDHYLTILNGAFTRVNIIEKDKVSGVTDMVFSDTTKQLYVSATNANDLVIDGATDKVVGAVRVSNSGPTRYNAASQKLYTAISGTPNMWVVQVATPSRPTVVGEMVVGESTRQLGVDAGMNVVYVSSKPGNQLSVINSKVDVVTNRITLSAPDSMAVNRINGQVFVGSSTADTVYMVQCRKGQ
ncbi:MAG: hypothetical protein K0S16_310 [Moraxellaceae bacterium]|jgi:6-phosphogluconolactonase (cycloisomerase 2 family)|nr:hypothetical protein [Moraxellaceae bacterium]